LAEFPRADVLLYLRTFAAHENTPWPRLTERLAALAESPDDSPPAGPRGPAGGRPAPQSSASGADRTGGSPPSASARAAADAGSSEGAGAQVTPRSPRSDDTVAERRGSAGRERPPPTGGATAAPTADEASAV